MHLAAGESGNERGEEVLKTSIIRMRSLTAAPRQGLGDNLCPHTRYAACLVSEGMQATVTDSEALLSADRLEASA